MKKFDITSWWDKKIGDLSKGMQQKVQFIACLLYTSDAADERSSVDLGGRRIIKKKNQILTVGGRVHQI